MGWVGGGKGGGHILVLLIISKWYGDGSISLSAFYYPSFHFARKMKKKF